jgi:hypothetical protein
MFRMAIRRLICINVLVFCLDVAVMCTQYAGLFEVHVASKGAAYSVKLFVEFFVLNQLAVISRTGTGLCFGDSVPDLSSAVTVNARVLLLLAVLTPTMPRGSLVLPRQPGKSSHTGRVMPFRTLGR